MGEIKQEEIINYINSMNKLPMPKLVWYAIGSDLIALFIMSLIYYLKTTKFDLILFNIILFFITMASGIYIGVLHKKDIGKEYAFWFVSLILMGYGFYGAGFLIFVLLLDTSLLVPLIFLSVIGVLVAFMVIYAERRSLVSGSVTQKSSIKSVSLGTAASGVGIGYTLSRIVVKNSNQSTMAIVLIAVMIFLGTLTFVQAFRVGYRYSVIKKFKIKS